IWKLKQQGCKISAIGIAQSGRRFAAQMPVPADDVPCPHVIHLEPGSVCLYGEETMDSTKDTKPGGLQNTFSRRNLLTGATALTAAASVAEGFGQQPTGAPFGTVWLYIGTYSVNLVQPPVQVPGPRGRNGKGIYLCQLDLHSGKLTVERLVAPAVPVAGTVQGTSSPS